MFPLVYRHCLASHGGVVVKNPPVNAGDARDMGSVPGLGRFPGVRNGTPPLHYSCLENFMGRGAWWDMSIVVVTQFSYKIF